MERYKRELETIGMKMSYGKALLAVISFAAFLALLEIFLLNTEEPVKTIIVLATAASIPALFHFFLDYLKEKRKKDIEEELPNALFLMASFPKRAQIETMIDAVAKQCRGPLAEEFEKENRSIKSGEPVEKALLQMGTDSESKLLKRAVSLLVSAQRGGQDASKSLKEIAENIFEMREIAKENASAFALQKYTLLIGGAIIVPAVLGTLLGMSANLGMEGTEEKGSIASEIFQQNSEVIPTFVLANQLYLLVFSALSGVFIAMQEGNIKKAALYFSFCAPVSFVVFHLAAGFRVA